MNLKGKRILIVGATSDIGFDIAKLCKKRGANVVATGRNTIRLSQLQKEGIDIVKLDLLNKEDVTNFVNSLPEFNGIVFSMGSVSFVPFIHEKSETIQEKVSIGFSAIASLLAQIHKLKRIKQNASIVFISSINGVTVGSIGTSVYSATKAAITGLSKSLALEMAVYGIRVNCICPGIIDTSQIHLNFSEEMIKRFSEDYPLKRIGTTDDVAKGAVFLLSDESSWITGINLLIDGGYSAR